MPFLESQLVTLLQATGGADGGLTAAALAGLAHAPVGRVRMTLRRMLDRGEVYISGGTGPDARFLLVSMHASSSRPPRSSPNDFGWGHTDARSDGMGGRARWTDPSVEVERLRAEVARLRADNQQLRAALQRRGGAGDDQRAMQDRIDDLIKLCHPDRHDNSARANAVTQWLLSMRKR